MRPLLTLALLALVIVGVLRPRPSYGKPEFARREGRACGYCHINPRGGGTRNQTGLLYARNELKFLARPGNLAATCQETGFRIAALCDRNSARMIEVHDVLAGMYEGQGVAIAHRPVRAGHRSD